MNTNGQPDPKGPASKEQVAETWLVALQNLVSVRSPMASRVYNRLKQQDGLSENQQTRLARLGPWATKAGKPHNPPGVAINEIPFGVLNYQATDLREASRNIGDWVQTVAMMSHIVRRPDVTLRGDQDLVDVFNELRSGIPDTNKISGPSRTLRLVEFNRDASNYDSLPENTMAFVFGWFMKRPFGGKSPFPLNPNISPIFISFHISRADFLTQEAIDYLRENGPVGCRDWHTVGLLLDAGVPAYFSGCVTTTIGALFPTASPSSEKPVAYVDAEIPDGMTNAVQVTNLNNTLRNGALVPGLKSAIKRLAEYRTDYTKLVTSRLHTYLPSWSMGVSVDWKPNDPNDRRFGGLAGDSAESLEEMQGRVSRISKAILDSILAGKSHGEVLEVHWVNAEEELIKAAERIGINPARNLERPNAATSHQKD